MIKHIILWKLKDEFGDEEKGNIGANAKQALEGLVGRIDGLITIRVETRRLPSSNADLMLYCEFESNDHLLAYQKNPLHCDVATTFVQPFVSQRLCLDYQDDA